LQLGSLRSLGTYADIKKAILTMDEEKIKEDNIGTLVQMVPEDDEQKQIAEHKFENDDDFFAEPEKFMKEISGVKNQRKRMEAWQTKMKFNNDFDSVLPHLTNMREACKEVCENKNFHTFLGLVLAFGNFLNGKNVKKVVHGFKIKSLSKLNDTKSSDNKTTLLQYLATHVAEKYPSLIDLFEILKCTPKATKFNISTIKDDIKNLKDGVKNVEQQIKIAEKENIEGDRFSETMSKFLEFSSSKLVTLEEELNNVFEDLKRVGKLYTISESDMLQKPDEFFNDLLEFMNLFKQAHEKNLSIIEKIEKEKKKESDAKKKRRRKTKKNGGKNKKSTKKR